jgi:N-acetylglutamate synthase-like GNAT family acetyltransferase
MLRYSVRAAAESDMPVVRDLLNRVSSCPQTLDWRRFVVAESDAGAIIGSGQIRPHFDGAPELASLAVDTPYRGQGVARAIIERLLAQGPRPLYTTCRAALGPLYEKFGFRAIGPIRMPPSFLSEYMLLFSLLRLVGLGSLFLGPTKSQSIRERTDAIRRSALVMRLG